MNDFINGVGAGIGIGILIITLLCTVFEKQTTLYKHGYQAGINHISSK